jgi:ribosome-binding factor A
MRREEEGAGHRHERVQGLILEELRALMRDDVSDPTLADVRVTAVVLSVDCRHARVHFALTTGIEQRPTASRALVRVTPFLRARLADAIDLKRTPDLRFIFDGGALSDDGGATCSE